MSVSARLANSFGILAVLASFALASPGVRVAQAEPQAEASAQCNAADAATAARASQVQDFLARVRAEQGRPGQEARGEGPEIIVLNNRGYNYGSNPSMDLDRVMIEAQQERR